MWSHDTSRWIACLDSSQLIVTWMSFIKEVKCQPIIWSMDTTLHDSTTAEVVLKSGNSSIQCSVTEVEQWSISNKLP